MTFHNADNYGAVLQCYALQRIVKSLGFDVVTNKTNELGVLIRIVPGGHTPVYYISSFQDLVSDIIR